MPNLNVNASLHVAGAYRQLQSDTGPWFFALALSAGWSEAPPGDAAPEPWRRALLPWELARECGEVVLYDADKDTMLGRAARIAPDAVFDPLVAHIKTEAEAGLHRIGPDLVWSGGAQAEFEYDAAHSAAAAVHGPALLHTLTRLPAPIALGMSAVLYFRCDHALVADLRNVARLAAVPDQLFDGVAGRTSQAGALTLQADGIVRCDYAGADAPVVYSEALDLAAARSSGLPDVLQTYWFPVETTDDAGLNDVDRIIADIVRAVPAVEFVNPQQLAAGATPWLQVAGARPTLEQAQAFWDQARAAAAALDAAQDADRARAELLDDAFATAGATVRERMHTAFRARVREHWHAIETTLPATLDGVPYLFDGAAAAAAWIDATFPIVPAATAVATPADAGLPFCVGDPATRLLYAAAAPSSPGAALRAAELAHPELGLDQIAAIGVLVKREAKPWRLVTAGVPVAADVDGLFDGSEPADRWLPRMLPAGLTVAFTNDLFSLDYAYEGAPMRTPDPRDRVHDTRLQNDTPAALDALAPFGLQCAGAVAGAVAARDYCKAPPLRYGDRYQLAAFAIDKVGGLPADLAGATTWDIDWTALDDLKPPLPSVERRFLRRALPGPVALVHATPGEGADWPPLQDGVALRALEDATSRAAGGTVPALVVSADAALDAVPLRRVRLVPPTIDEHTLTRWAMPGSDTATAGAERDRLFNALLAIHTKRLALQTGAAPMPGLFPHDPAIDGFLVTGHWVDRDGKSHPFARTGTDACIVPLAWPADGYLIADAQLPVLDVVAGTGEPPLPVYDRATNRATLHLPPGSYAVLEIAPLLGKAAADRFDPAALQGRTAPGGVAGQVALAPDVLVAEHAVADLPAGPDLYDALTLRAQARSVDVTLQRCPGLVFVDRFALQRQRWAWRNRPLLSPALVPGNTLPAAERRRLLVSGLPAELLSDVANERDSGPARAFDDLARLDKGLVDRTDYAARFPRERDAAGSAALLVDLLDGTDRAEYLRYGLQVTSRYAPLFRPAARARSTASARRAADRETWRRIAMPYRGSGATLRPPKVMAVIPLTQGFALPDEDGGDRGRATPVLVILDEVWFRDFGPGDRLEVRLALENADIGEAPLAPRPYRTGGLPDHHRASAGSGAPYDPDRYYGKRLVTPEEDAAAPVLLDVFGPFGYSLDRSGNQALANATAFVAFPPADVAPHSAMFVRLARVLDRPSGNQRSAATDAHPVYTLPDAADLIAPGKRAGGRVVLRAATGALAYEDVALNCRPWTPAPGTPGDDDARRNYLYCMLVSELVADGGRGLDAELPVAMVVLDGAIRPQTGAPIPHAALAPGRRYRARVLELLMNGKGAGRAGLTAAADLRAFWEQLLPWRDDDDTGADAVAMIRRVSPAFVLDVES
ncbi:hypothetical protein SAMN05428966_103421 [Massilia sp. PDC64]|nr:hypothetical protein [Massilia sp. PDC64]SDD19076.1 hypothetical protein SAMN05428966_103421 [Massilia sp. PDC64]